VQTCKDIHTFITALIANVVIDYVIMVTLVTKIFRVYTPVRAMGMPHERFALPT
jgi:hypothetical protein